MCMSGNLNKYIPRFTKSMHMGMEECMDMGVHGNGRMYSHGNTWEWKNVWEWRQLSTQMDVVLSFNQ